MSTFEDKTRSKICPDLNPVASQEPLVIHLKKLTEIEALWLKFGNGL